MKLGYVYAGKVKGNLDLGVDPYSGIASTFTLENSIILGSLAVPITQVVATQKGMTCVIAANVLGGEVAGGYFGSIATITRAGDVVGAHTKVAVNAGVVLTGNAFGLYIEANVIGTGQTPQNLEGARIMVGAEATSNIGNIYGIFMSNYVVAGATFVNYYFARFSENGGVTITAGFMFSVGGGSDMTNLFDFVNACTAWNPLTVNAGAHTGIIAVRVQGVQRYIRLYQ